MKPKCFLFICLICTAFSLTAQTDQEIENNPTKAKEAKEELKNRPSAIDVTDNIFMLQGMGGNIAVQHGIDGVFMIDTQFERISESIASLIRQKTNDTTEFVVNTHMHGDHTGGNKSFTRKGATVLAHKNVRNAMISKMYTEAGKDRAEKQKKDLAKLEAEGASGKANALRGALKEGNNEVVGAGFEIDQEALPAIAFENDLLFHYNDEDIIMTHLPNAHTNGDVVVQFKKSDVIHTGDAFFNGRYPYIDLESGGSYKGYIKGLVTIQNLAGNDTKIIPGHGDLARKGDVLEVQKMLETLYSRVKLHYLQDKTEDEIAAMRDFTQFYDEKGYGDGYITTEKILRTLYKEVDKNEGNYKRQQKLKQKKYEEMKKKSGN